MLPQSVGRRYPGVSSEQAALLLLAVMAAPNAAKAPERARTCAKLVLVKGYLGSLTTLGSVLSSCLEDRVVLKQPLLGIGDWQLDCRAQL